MCEESRTLDDRDTRRSLLDVRFDVARYAQDLERDLPLMPLRWLGDPQERDIYGVFDRYRAEAEFRAAVALPLLALVAVLSIRSSPWWVLAVTAPALLVVEALHSATAAADVLAESVRARPAQCPALATLRAGRLQAREDEGVAYAARLNYPGALTRQAASLEARGDILEAERLYRAAANGGVGVAMMWLAGVLHLRHNPEAERWYEKACEAGEPDAKTIKELRSVFTSAQLCDLKAAYAGRLEAMTRVGGYFEGWQRPEQAEEWYRKAHDAGDRPALDALIALLRKQGESYGADALERQAAAQADAQRELSEQRTGGSAW